MHDELIKRNKLDQGWVYMQVTRGSADRDFKFPKDAKSTLVAFTQVQEAHRQSRCGARASRSSPFPISAGCRRDIKSVMLLAPVLGKQAAL